MDDRIAGEGSVRVLIERLAASDAPPTRVDIERTEQTGRRRQRWRRAGLRGTPVLLSAVVLAVLLVPGQLSGSATRPSEATGEHPSPADPVRPANPYKPAQAPRQLSPLVPYATFGWLPGAVSEKLGWEYDSDLTTEDLQPATKGDVQLQVYAAGTCNLTARQVATALRRRRPAGGPYLRCPGEGAPVPYRAPAIHGRLAFWWSGLPDPYASNLVWEYAPNGWAELNTSPMRPAKLLKIARAIRYGAATRLAFPFQLTGMPGKWQPTRGIWTASGSHLSGSGFLFEAGSTMIWVNVMPVALSRKDILLGGPHGTCTFNSDVSARTRYVTLDGIRFSRNFTTDLGYRIDEVCAPSVNGLFVAITVVWRSGAEPLGGPAAIYLEHLRLLGTNAARWTRYPLG